MVIDRTHRKWAIGVAAATFLAAAVYIPYYLQAPHGPSGGSWPGLIYGSAGFALMAVAGLLGLRKKFPNWRIGRAQTWMRAHLWLGLLALPLILFHSGFSFGRGTLTSLLMILLLLVTASGIFGAVMQHFMPRLMTAQLPMETIYAEVDNVRASLRAEAEKLVAVALAPPKAAKAAAAGAEAPPAPPPATSPAGNGSDARAVLQEFFDKSVQPLLLRPQERGHVLRHARQARAEFERVRRRIPPELHDALADLEEICEEERQLARQVQLHHWLHLWLLVHVPLSYALLLLGAAHAVMALRY